MKKITFLASAIILASLSFATKAQQITGSAVHSPNAGGARILANQGNTAANPAIGFQSAVSTTSTAENDNGQGNGIFRPLAHNMAFATGSLERMRINENGQIGINVNNPTAYLHTSGLVRFENLPTTSATRFLMTDANGYVSSIPVAGVASDRWSLAGNNIASTDFIGSTNSEPLNFKTDNVQKMILTANGRLGIGTTAPASGFHLLGGSDAGQTIPNLILQRADASTQNATFSMGISNGAWAGITGIAPGSVFFKNTKGDMVFSSNNTSPQMIIRNNGTMGVNNLNPQGQFDVLNLSTANGAGQKIGVYSKAPHMGIFGLATSADKTFTEEGVRLGWKEAIGILGQGFYVTGGGQGKMIGVVGTANSANPQDNIGVFGEAKTGTESNIGVIGISRPAVNTTQGKYNVGVLAEVGQNTLATSWNAALSATAPVAANHYAGHFDGNVVVETGNVKIGNTSTPTGYKLFVEQGILTEKVKVALASSAAWADYVFAKDYKLQPLAEVEKFVIENKHLPNIPSAANLAKDGLDLGQMQAKQMEKIEELTLYLIELNKKVTLLEQKNAILEKQLAK